MKKKLTALLLTAVLAAGMTACTATGNGSSPNKQNSAPAESSSKPEIRVKTVDEIKAEMKEEAAANDGRIVLRVWTNYEEEDVYQKLADEFTEIYGDPSYEIKIGIEEVPPENAAYRMEKFPKAYPDVFKTDTEHYSQFIKEGKLKEIDSAYYGDISEVFTEQAVQELTKDGVIYAYPACYYTLILLYNKNIYTDPQDIESLDSLIAKAHENGKKFFFSLDNLYYSTSLFFAAGMDIKHMDDNQTADFTSEEAFEGFKSIRYYCEMIGNGFSTEAETNHFSASLALLYRDQNDAVAGVISYNWPVMITAKRRHLLDDGHIGIAKLPTALINGSQKQLEPFGTMLCYAVSSTTKYPASAQAFALQIRSPIWYFFPMR